MSDTMQTGRDELQALAMSTRATQCLRGEGLLTLAAIISANDCDLMRIPNFGRKSLREVRAATSAVIVHHPKPSPFIAAVDAAMAHAPRDAIDREQCAVMVEAALKAWFEDSVGLLG